MPKPATIPWAQRRIYDLTTTILWVVFRFGFGFEVRGREHVPKRGAFIVACNHVSYLDPPVLGVACPRQLSFLARGSLFQHALLGAFLRGVHAIPLRRGEADLGAVRQAVVRLESGEPVALFPEGTRQLSGQLGAAKRGVGLLAIAAAVPIIPALVSGTRRALPPGATRLSRAKIRVAFGSAISYTTGLPQGSRRDHQQHVADAVTQAWRRLALEQVASDDVH